MCCQTTTNLVNSWNYCQKNWGDLPSVLVFFINMCFIAMGTLGLNPSNVQIHDFDSTWSRFFANKLSIKNIMLPMIFPIYSQVELNILYNNESVDVLKRNKMNGDIHAFVWAKMRFPPFLYKIAVPFLVWEPSYFVNTNSGHLHILYHHTSCINDTNSFEKHTLWNFLRNFSNLFLDKLCPYYVNDLFTVV